VDVRFVPLDLARVDALRYEAVALPFFQDERPLRGAAGLCDWRLCGRLSRLLHGGRVTGALGEVTLVPTRPRLPFDKLLLFGSGARETFDAAAFATVAARIYDVVEGLRLRNLVLSLPGRNHDRVTPSEAIRWFLEASTNQSRLEELIVLDDADAHKVMQPLVDAERRRARAAREV
jgi:Cytosol aminopeptidase family, N-terminal domain